MWIIEDIIDDKNLDRVYFEEIASAERSKNVEGGGEGRGEKAKGNEWWDNRSIDF
jgi:hypothetical protein